MSTEVMCLGSGTVKSPTSVEFQEHSHHHRTPGTHREGGRSFWVRVRGHLQSVNLQAVMVEAISLVPACSFPCRFPEGYVSTGSPNQKIGYQSSLSRQLERRRIKGGVSSSRLHWAL